MSNEYMLSRAGHALLHYQLQQEQKQGNMR